MTTEASKRAIHQSPDAELDIFLAKSTLGFKKWSFLVGLLSYSSFTALDFFRFPSELYSTTVPARVLFVLIPLCIAVYVHWTKPISSTRAYISLNTTIYLATGLVNVLVYAELGFVLIILFGCLMISLPILHATMVSIFLIVVLFFVYSLVEGFVIAHVFQISVYACVATLCLIVHASFQRLLTDNYNMIQQFYGDSITDRLTGLKNNRYFVKQTLQLIQQGKAENKEVSLVIIDIDNFKEINDKYGHAYGDDCLSKLGKTLRSVCRREHDFPCRFAGDEFTIVMYDASKQEVMKVCQDILTDIQLYDVEVSIGNATSKIEKSVPAIVIKNKLFEQADKALYKAKENGRNMVFSAADLEG